MDDSFYQIVEVEAFLPTGGLSPVRSCIGGEIMNNQLPKNITYPDQDTLRTWENMRKEILHELQEGASADVPDSEIDVLETLVIELEYWRAQKKLRLLEVLNRSKNELAKNVN